MTAKNNWVILFTILGFAAHAQLPENLVPNYDFEQGTTLADPDKNCYVLDGKINDWYFADPHPGLQASEGWRKDNDGVWYSSDECDGAGWSDQNLTEDVDRWQVGYYNAPSYSNKYIYVEYAESRGAGRGVRCLLKSPIVASESKKYFVRAKLNFEDADHGYVAFHFTKWGEHWNDDDNENRRMWDALKFYYSYNQLEVPYSNKHKWEVYEGVFVSTWDSRYVDQLKNINIVGGDLGENPFAIDDVELFEYCSAEMQRQNRHYYLGKEKEEAGIISAGFQNLASASGPVVIHSPSERFESGTNELRQIYAPQVVYKAESEVNLVPGFIVERGGEFTAKIAPCGRECFSSNLNIPNARFVSKATLLCLFTI